METEKRRRAAKTSLIAFTEHTYRRYEAAPIHRQIAEHLERIERGDGLVGQLMDKFAPGRLPIEAFEWKGDNGYSREIDVYSPLRDSFMTL